MISPQISKLLELFLTQVKGNGCTTKHSIEFPVLNSPVFIFVVYIVSFAARWIKQ
jgi:hypothetical protein